MPVASASEDVVKAHPTDPSHGPYFKKLEPIVLMFVGQLEDPPTSFEGVERTACRKLFPGPAFWITSGVLQNLKILGFPAELPILSNLALAAKSRVCRCENQQHGGLLVYQRARRLRQALASCDDLARLSWVHTWAQGNFLFRLEAADLQVQECLEARKTDSVV